MDAQYRHALLGGNGRMDALQAAVLRVRLAHIEAWNERRRENAALYDRLLTESGLPQQLEGFVMPPAVPEGEVANYHQYTLRVPNRDALLGYLRERQISAAVYYPIPLPMQPVYQHLNVKEGDYPNAEAAAREVISLPIHQFLAHDEIERVAEAIVSFYSQ
jgi:dTDP-4-amino-4,6-dideoxygalactose transaminase